MSRLTGTLWEEVALRRTRAAADPDALPRPVALPASWEEAAAEALAAIAPGEEPVALPRLAEQWISRVVARGRKLNLLAGEAEAGAFAEGLRGLLLARRGAPGLGTWRGEAKGEPRFVLNLPAFLEPSEGGAAPGFDIAGYIAAVTLGVRALEILTGAKAHHLALGFADLAGLLAGLGLPYDGAEARAVAGCVAALTRGAAEMESGRLAGLLGGREPVCLLWPVPPAQCVVPGLAEAARSVMEGAAASPHGLRHAAIVSLAPADAVEALLGAETAGLAPAPGPTRAGLDAQGYPAELATAAARRAGRLFGLPVQQRPGQPMPGRIMALLAPPSPDARLAMSRMVTAFLHAAPPVPSAIPAAPRAAPPPRSAARHEGGAPARGTIRRVVIGGHRVTLRTAESSDGVLVDIAFSLAKESAALKAMLDALAEAVSIGLAHGVPLASFVEAYAYSSGGANGAVEGDAHILRATSILDWAFRRLARDYLGRTDLPDPGEEDILPEQLATPPASAGPMLPLDLPPQLSPTARRRMLRLVG